MITDPVGSPTEGPQVGVIKRVLIRRRGLLRVGFRNALVEARVLQVRIEVIRRLLTSRIRRVSDHHVDGSILLPFNGRVVLLENL